MLVRLEAVLIALLAIGPVWEVDRPIGASEVVVGPRLKILSWSYRDCKDTGWPI